MVHGVKVAAPERERHLQLTPRSGVTLQLDYFLINAERFRVKTAWLDWAIRRTLRGEGHSPRARRNVVSMRANVFARKGSDGGPHSERRVAGYKNRGWWL